jgi:protein SCO1
MVQGGMTDTTTPKRRPPKLAIALSLAAIALGGAVAFGYLKKNETAKVAALPGNCNSRAFAEIGGPFSLVNQDKAPVTEKDLLGKPALIFFGFTYCPDVCPMALQTMALSLDEAKAAGGRDIDQIQPVLISFDPTRDTPASLKKYVSAEGFPKGLIGLTGSQAQVDVAVKAFKVGVTKAASTTKDPMDYTLNHTSLVYLMGRDGKLRTFFNDSQDPKEVGQCIAALSKAGL